jgi:hypothetical protein
MPHMAHVSRPHRQRALTFLARSADGHAEATLHAHGFTREMLAGLIREGLATATTARVGRWLRDVVRIKITPAGRAALSEPRGRQSAGEEYDPASRGASGITEPPSIPDVNPIMAINGKAEDERPSLGARPDNRGANVSWHEIAMVS